MRASATTSWEIEEKGGLFREEDRATQHLPQASFRAGAQHYLHMNVGASGAEAPPFTFRPEDHLSSTQLFLYSSPILNWQRAIDGIDCSSKITDEILCNDCSGNSSEMAPCLFSMSDAKLRNAMHNFIDCELDMSPLVDADFTSEYLGLQKMSLESFRTHMHQKVELMDFHTILHIHRHGKLPASSCVSSEFACDIGILNEDKHIHGAFRCSSVMRYVQHHLLAYTRRLILMRNKTSMEALLGEAEFILSMNKCFSFYELLEYIDSIASKHEHQRAEFLERAALQPPATLRVIDIEATCLGQQVVLLDYWSDANVQQVGYSAISHTFGLGVYEVFNCQCATKCSANVLRPRCSVQPCPHTDDRAEIAPSIEMHNRVVNDILRMCVYLMAAGVQYAWHDGVCIAQFDEAEVEATIKCMGWIYSNAKETIVFLHYVGKPVAPIKNGAFQDGLSCRWHKRVWTLQEAALSNCRRYCVRVGTSPLGDCESPEEFEKKIAMLYADNTSKVEVIEERRLCEMLVEYEKVLLPLCDQYYTEGRKVLQAISIHQIDVGMYEPNLLPSKAFMKMWTKVNVWTSCIVSLVKTLLDTCFEFPSARSAMEIGSGRASKHVGDHINSILALSSVKDFIAPKDVNHMEASTIEFFKRQGQGGLDYAVFTTNTQFTLRDKDYVDQVCKHTWPPLLFRQLISVVNGDNMLQYKVLKDGKLEVSGELLCVKVEFTVKLDDKVHEEDNLVPQNFVVLDPSRDTIVMDLTRFQAALKATFPYVSAYSMGLALLPYILVLEHTWNSCTFPAHVVLPKQVMGRNYKDAPWPALVVTGDVHTEVLKMGCFKATNQFLAIIEHILDWPSIQILNKLIIN